MDDGGTAAEAARGTRSARENGATRVLPAPTDGRVYRSHRQVRLGDADPSGRLRLDAIARYLQDVATDDSSDARDTDTEAWVVRRTLLEQRAALRIDDEVELSTYCTGTGSRWAERTTSIVADLDGSSHGSVATSTVWVHLDGTSGRPKALPESFTRVYGVSAAGREIAARQLHEPVALDGTDVHSSPWWPRVTDLDVLDHVNNAVAWEVVEQVMARAMARGLLDLDPAGALRVEVEFRDAVDRSAVDASTPLTISYRVIDGGLELTLWSADATTVHVTASVRSLG